MLDDRAELVGTSVANPGLDFYRSREPVRAPRALLDERLTVTDEGTRLSFSTPGGDTFWVSSDAYGTGI